MKTVALLALLVIISLFSVNYSKAASYNVVGTASLYIFGVQNVNGTITGVPAELNLTITNGTGKVFLGSTPLTDTDTQAQAVISANVACQLLNVNCLKYNFYYTITSQSVEIGGPSAGGAFAVAAMSILSGKPIRSDVAMTGTANPDGTVGAVGDVSQKSEAAALKGIKIFLYPSSNNMSLSAQQYDQSSGMATVQVSSLYQAYDYFTGYNVTPSVNANIYTPLYNALMLKTYQEFNSYQTSLYNTVSSSTANSSQISALILQAKSAMLAENTLATQGQYYVAASYMVNTSATDLVNAIVLQQLSSSANQSSTLSGLIANEESAISATYNNVTQNFITNSSTLDVKFIAIDRLSQASEFLNDSISALSSGNINEAAYFYALSEVKRASALFWVSILPRGASNFSQSDYSNISLYYLNKASAYQIYSQLIGVNDPTQTSNLQYYISQATGYYDGGQYIPSIFYSIEAIGTSELLIEEASIVNGSLTQVNSGLSTSALNIINSAERSGITPFLGISYYQYANSSSNQANEILFYSLARGSTIFEQTLSNSSLIPSVPVQQPYSVNIPLSTSQYLQLLAYLVLGFALGVIISGLIFEYKLFLILRKHGLTRKDLAAKKRHARIRKRR